MLVEIGRASGRCTARWRWQPASTPRRVSSSTESQRRRLDDARKVVGPLRDLKALTTDITYQEAVDLVWLAMDPALFDRLVRVRGWSISRFEEWLASTLCGQLLG